MKLLAHGKSKLLWGNKSIAVACCHFLIVRQMSHLALRAANDQRPKPDGDRGRESVMKRENGQRERERDEERVWTEGEREG